jgi:hypothetical protein
LEGAKLGRAQSNQVTTSTGEQRRGGLALFVAERHEVDRIEGRLQGELRDRCEERRDGCVAQSMGSRTAAQSKRSPPAETNNRAASSETSASTMSDVR